MEEAELREAARGLLREARELHDGLQGLQDVYGQPLDGCLKLQRKVDAEIKFLNEKLRSGVVKESHVNCSNLPHLRAVRDACSLFPRLTAILKPFSTKPACYPPLPTPAPDHSEEEEEVPLVVDAVAEEGFMWVKVIARSADGLLNNWTGNCEMSHRPLQEQLEQYLDLAEECTIYYKQPKVALYFANGVHKSMADDIAELGIEVCGRIIDGDISEMRLPDTTDIKSSSSHKSRLVNSLFVHELGTVNMDVSALLALTSNLSHGSLGWDFPSDILNDQVKDERQHPKQLWDELSTFIQGKKLVACQTALVSFHQILNVVGGPTERKRAEKLLERVTIVDDQMTESVGSVPLSSAVKQRSKIIFGTGDFLQAVTLTSNLSCVRSIRQTGVYFPVYLHVARALTEQKEQTGRMGDVPHLECACDLCQHCPRPR